MIDNVLKETKVQNVFETEMYKITVKQCTNGMLMAGSPRIQYPVVKIQRTLLKSENIYAV